MRLAILLTIIALQLFGGLATVSTVGKPRQPMTGGLAAVTMLVALAMAIAVTYLYIS